MTSRRPRYAFPHVMRDLKDFQRDTVEHVIRRMYLDPQPATRFLVADEVGLGKTMVARGVIAKAIEHLQDSIPRIDIVYICSNAEIARQNIRRLNVTDKQDFPLADRITLLPLHMHTLGRSRDRRLNFVSFTPGTSLNLKSTEGRATERALLHRMLRDAWGTAVMRGKPALHVLRVDCGTRSFEGEVAWVATQAVDKGISRRFARALTKRTELRSQFLTLREDFRYAGRRNWRPPPEVRRRQRELIGDLRELLARVCVDALEPDLIILDEFQRFKRLLDGDDPVAELAQQLFRWGEGEDHAARVLLLSATPYRMYSLGDERAESHYDDFVATLKFLMAGNPTTIETFKAALGDYRQALMRLGETGSDADVLRCRDRVRDVLELVMVRTERLAVTEDRSGMLVERPCQKMELTPGDVGRYLAADKLARTLRAGDVIEYWKSAPHLLTFMDEYKLIREFDHARERGDVPDPPSELLVAWDRVRNYQPVDAGNARLRDLWSEMLDTRSWEALWVPPSLPYYELGAPYADLSRKGFTKRLVFSSWTVAPKAIAAMTSYEAERRIVKRAGRTRRNTPEARKRVRSLLQFAAKDGRLAGMPVFALMYPSVRLAELCDPLDLSREVGGGERVPTQDQLLRAARDRLAPRIERITAGRPSEGREDEAWYWAAPVLLDDENGAAWLAQDDAAAIWTAGTDESGSRFAEHLALAASPPQLGRPPSDLLDVVALLAVAGPATCALRALGRHGGGAYAVRMGAARVAWALRALFGVVEVMTLLRDGGAGQADDDAYWRRVLDHCFKGGLQAVLDEYTHVLVEPGTPPDSQTAQITAQMTDAIGLRTAVLHGREYTPEGGFEQRAIRTRYALRFGDQRSEDNIDARSGLVRQAFNSPFWPFVLATTSVGQEGLDFHLYCHAVVHWNLPANPVDLEQREGRVHRYKGHAVRKNVATAYRTEALSSGSDPWAAAFAAGDAARTGNQNQLVPGWMFPLRDGARIERYVPALPLSREVEQLARLKRSMAAYRLAFGQPRQDDLVEYLEDRIEPHRLAKLGEELRIDLSPPKAEPQPLDG